MPCRPHKPESWIVTSDRSQFKEYTLAKTKAFKLIVRADHNDADYMEDSSPITQKQLDKFLPLIKAIKKITKKQSHNWPRGEYCCREDLGEPTVEEIYSQFSKKLIAEFEEFIPTSEGNIHTIESITLLEIEKETKLL